MIKNIKYKYPHHYLINHDFKNLKFDIHYNSLIDEQIYVVANFL